MSYPPPPIDRSRIRPRLVWYWVAGVVLVLGWALAGVLVFFLIKQVTGPIDRFTTPGGVEVELDRDEGKTIYAHTEGVAASRETDAEEIDCMARNVRTARRVKISQTVGSFTLERGDDNYEALLKFSAPEKGRYRVSCRAVTDPEQEIALAVGPRVRIFGFVGSILGALGAFLGSVFMAGVIAALTAVFRYQSKKRLEREAMGQGPAAS